MSYKSFDLTRAFPSSLHASASGLMLSLDQPIPYRSTFSVIVEGESVLIPDRIYEDLFTKNLAGISNLQSELLHCLMTRHHIGVLRQEHLAQVLCLPNPWIPPFVVQLAGEYVIEILDLIRNNLHKLDVELYRRFLAENEAFFCATKQRAMSYWDCHHRSHRKEDYVGFRIIGFFDRLIAQIPE